MILILSITSTIYCIQQQLILFRVEMRSTTTIVNRNNYFDPLLGIATLHYSHMSRVPAATGQCCQILGANIMHQVYEIIVFYNTHTQKRSVHRGNLY
jgi:hypothetical protein